MLLTVFDYTQGFFEKKERDSAASFPFESHPNILLLPVKKRRNSKTGGISSYAGFNDQV